MTARQPPFDPTLDYKHLNLRKRPELYRIGKGEQGVLSVEPYKSEILPLWRFRTPAIARDSAKKIYEKYLAYREQEDFVGMDMARKFLQMGYTRSRRYANHASGRKYDSRGRVQPSDPDTTKARCAEIFKKVWKRVEADPIYIQRKRDHLAWTQTLIQ